MRWARRNGRSIRHVIFFSKVRRSVKLQYCDAIDNAEYEPLMQNLLDTHLSVAGLKKITSPIDILNKDDFEKELEELGSLRSKADAIASRMTRSISEKRDENPAYYDSFSKRIRDALALYKEKVISEAEYLAKMRTIMEDYHAGRSTVSYPERIKNNVHAQAFFGVLTALFDEVEDERITPDFVAEVSEEITKSSPPTVRWTGRTTRPSTTAFHRTSTICLQIRKGAWSEALVRSHRQDHRQCQDCCPAEVLSDGHHLPTNHNRRWARNPIQS